MPTITWSHHMTNPFLLTVEKEDCQANVKAKRRPQEELQLALVFEF